MRRSILARPDDPTRLRPIQIRMSTDYPVPDEIATALATLKRNMRVGIQYQWLAAFCAHEGISGIELCFERNPIEEEPLHKLLKQFIDPEQSARADPSVRAIFKYFSIALTDLTKADMVTIARQHGFYDILTGAWSCHRPILGAQCGYCHPCRLTRERGVPVRFSRLRFLVRPFRYAQAWLGRARRAAAARRPTSRHGPQREPAHAPANQH